MNAVALIKGTSGERVAKFTFSLLRNFKSCAAANLLTKATCTSSQAEIKFFVSFQWKKSNVGYCRIAHSDNHSVTHIMKVACPYDVGITNIWSYCRVVWRDRARGSEGTVCCEGKRRTEYAVTVERLSSG